MVVVMLRRTMLLMEQVVELFSCMLLQKMGNYTRDMKPLVHLKRTKCVEG